MMRFLRRRRADADAAEVAEAGADRRADGAPADAALTDAALTDAGPTDAATTVAGPTDVAPESGITADARAKAEEFWRRWDQLLPEVAAALGEGAPQRFDHQLAEAVAAVHPNLTFSVEQGERAVYALVISAQADPELRPYTDAWKAAAPESAAPGANALFEYHDSVPPVPDPTQVTVNLRDRRYALDEVRVFARVDEGEGLVDVAVYHPGFAGLESEARSALTFLPLDAALGERLAADRLGRVETAEAEPSGAVGLLEFRDLVRRLDDPTRPE